MLTCLQPNPSRANHLRGCPRFGKLLVAQWTKRVTLTAHLFGDRVDLIADSPVHRRIALEARRITAVGNELATVVDLLLKPCVCQAE